MRNAKIVIFAGDGVGPEVMDGARTVLAAIAGRFDLTFEFSELLIGGAAYDAYEEPIRDEDIAECRQADAALLGAVGGPKWEAVEREVRPEQGLLRLRKALRLFANLRPVAVQPALADASPLKPEIIAGVDLLVVRELTGGIYFGRPRRRTHERRGQVAVDTLIYREHEIERVLRLGFDLARERHGRLASVDKANVLESSRLWREVTTRLAPEYPDVKLDHILVDAMAMHLIRQPARYDVVVTENMFGDILTDEASMIAGSIGLLPSASLGPARPDDAAGRFGLFEPIHGSAPDIAGQGIANPIGTILSAAMMLRLSLGEPAAATAIEEAVAETLARGLRTADIAAPGGTKVSTSEMASAVAAAVAG